MFDPFFSGREALRIQSGYFGVKSNEAWIDGLLEGLGLAGVLGASVVPAWLLQPGAAEPQRGLALYALGFAALLVAGMVLLLRAAPARAGPRDDQAPAWREAWSSPDLIHL